MGFAFLPIALGALLAGPLGGFLLQKYLKESMQPDKAWMILSTLGFVSTAALLAYDRWVARPTVRVVGLGQVLIFYYSRRL